MMNLFVLILIAIPLVLYLVVLVFSSRDFDPGETTVSHADESAPVRGEQTGHLAEQETVSATPSDVAETAVLDDDKLARSEPGANESAHAEVAVSVAPSLVVAVVDEPTSAEAENAEELVADVVASEPEQPAAANGAAAGIQDAEPAPPPAVETAAVLAETIPSEPAISESPQAKVETTEPGTSAEPPSKREDESPQPILSGQPLILPEDAPKYAFDYRGRLWVEKKRRGFFRQLRRPQLPPEDPTDKSNP